MGLVLRFPLERRRVAGPDLGDTPRGAVLLLPVIRIERHDIQRHDLPAPPMLTVEPPLRGGDKPRRRRKSA
ncbi:hypothetical protein [Phreatobacter sp.]|uniref:hypothetical protein n=1 Tax=Phreatobacter sp. TaxID=1966341 RepID=UPI003F71DFA3